MPTLKVCLEIFHEPGITGDRVVLPKNLVPRDDFMGVLVCRLTNSVIGGLNLVTGIQEYTAENGYIIISNQLRENLVVEAGDDLDVEFIDDLCPGSQVTFQPEDWRFAELGEPVPILTEWLKNHTALNVGQQLRFDDHILTVVDLQPVHEALIRDVDLDLIILPAKIAKPESTAAASNTSVVSSNEAASSSSLVASSSQGFTFQAESVSSLCKRYLMETAQVRIDAAQRATLKAALRATSTKNK